MSKKNGNINLIKTLKKEIPPIEKDLKATSRYNKIQKLKDRGLIPQSYGTLDLNDIVLIASVLMQKEK